MVLGFDNDNLFNFVTLADGVNHFQSLVNLAKTGMVAVEVFGIVSAVADEKL